MHRPICWSQKGVRGSKGGGRRMKSSGVKVEIPFLWSFSSTKVYIQVMWYIKPSDWSYFHILLLGNLFDSATFYRDFVTNGLGIALNIVNCLRRGRQCEGSTYHGWTWWTPIPGVCDKYQVCLDLGHFCLMHRPPLNHWAWSLFPRFPCVGNCRIGRRLWISSTA